MPARSILWPDPRVKPSYGSVEIDRAHPLASGLGYVYLANEGAGILHDLVKPRTADGFGVTLTNPTWGPSPGGLAHVDTIWQTTPDAELYGATDISVLVVLRDALNTSVIQTLTGVYDGIVTNFGAWRLMIDDVDTAFNSFQFRLGASPTKVNTSTTTRQAGLHAYGFVIHGSTDLIYCRDGGYVETKSHSVALAGQANCRPQIIGATAATGVQTVATLMWTRALATADMQWATAEPYAVLRPLIRRRYFVAAAGPTIIEATGSATGVATITGVSGAIAGSELTAAGLGTASGIGAAVWLGTLLSTGMATVTGVSGATAGVVGTSEGIAVVTGQGEDAANPGGGGTLMLRHHHYGL